MTISLGREIEQVRKQKKIPIWCICNVMNLKSEREYDDLIHNRFSPSVMQLIMLTELMEHGFESVLNDPKYKP
ncbi:MAG: hypothetical protein E7006_03715 [Alphaproteobacteria bacterium]|nr:hypothetical protein [Alphaproteobacteria bacterium]